MDILQRVNSHEDLLKLSDGERSQLCDEIRQFLISSVAKPADIWRAIWVWWS